MSSIQNKKPIIGSSDDGGASKQENIDGSEGSPPNIGMLSEPEKSVLKIKYLLKIPPVKKNEIQLPTRRYALDTWKQYCNILTPDMIEHLEHLVKRQKVFLYDYGYYPQSARKKMKKHKENGNEWPNTSAGSLESAVSECSEKRNGKTCSNKKTLRNGSSLKDNRLNGDIEDDKMVIRRNRDKKNRLGLKSKSVKKRGRPQKKGKLNQNRVVTLVSSVLQSGGESDEQNNLEDGIENESSQQNEERGIQKQKGLKANISDGDNDEFDEKSSNAEFKTKTSKKGDEQKSTVENQNHERESTETKHNPSKLKEKKKALLTSNTASMGKSNDGKFKNKSSHGEQLLSENLKTHPEQGDVHSLHKSNSFSEVNEEHLVSENIVSHIKEEIVNSLDQENRLAGRQDEVERTRNGAAIPTQSEHVNVEDESRVQALETHLISDATKDKVTNQSSAEEKEAFLDEKNEENNNTMHGMNAHGNQENYKDISSMMTEKDVLSPQHGFPKLDKIGELQPLNIKGNDGTVPMIVSTGGVRKQETLMPITKKHGYCPCFQMFLEKCTPVLE